MQCILEILDVETHCILEDIKVDWCDIEEFFPQGFEALEYNETEFDEVRSGRVRDKFKLKTPLVCYKVMVRKKVVFDELPYATHNRRELLLMLSQKKPLAVFVDSKIDGFSDLFPEELFDKHVVSGLFVKNVFLEKAGDSFLRRVLYSLKDESWRINAYNFIYEVSNKLGWNDVFERLEGLLLGYTENEMEMYFEVRKKWGKA